ncbi:MAG TPA: carbohydrate ABC transporter permease [Clostridiales bacterium]|nr:carbohydrate ABC transporter permease [Clostridiales bacterium]
MNVRSKEEKRFELAGHIVMITLCFFAIMPFLLLIASSITDHDVVVREGYKFIPKEFSLEAYRYIFGEWAQIGHAYLITIIVTVSGTFLSIMITTMFAFGLNYTDIPGTKVLFIMCLFTMLFNGGIVATYYTYSNFIHIKNTIFALIVPGLMMGAFNVILVKNYIKNNIPGELIEAAEMDGAGPIYIFFKLIIPLSTPILATIGLMGAVMYWNDWTNGLYYITNSKLYSIQQLLNQMNSSIQYLISNANNLGNVDLSTLPSTTMRMAIAVVAILPILCTYPFFQKYFAKGITVGAVKG